MLSYIDIPTRPKWLWGPRLLIVAAWLVFGVFRAGVDRLDRSLTAACWDVPSLWSAVAKTAVRTGAVQPYVGGTVARLQRAAVQDFFNTRCAIVTLSDSHRSHIYIIDADYNVLARFRRQTSNALLVQDRWRGLTPLSHLWPVYDSAGDGRLSTLIGFSPVGSVRQAAGTYAYITMGQDRNEVLFVCHVNAGRGRRPVMLSIEDYTRDGLDDLVVHPVERHGAKRIVRPEALAVFRWNKEKRAFEPQVTEGTESVLAYWCSAPGRRVTFQPDEWMDEELVQMLPVIGHRTALQDPNPTPDDRSTARPSEPATRPGSHGR